MSKFKSYLLFYFFLLAILVFIFIGAIIGSAFSDNFNDGTMSQWNIVSGSWSTGLSFDGTNSTTVSSSCYGACTVTNSAYVNVSGASYFSVSMRSLGSDAGGYNNFYSGFRFLSNGISYMSVTLGKNIISQTGTTDYAITEGEWYTITEEISGSNVIQKIYNASTGSLLRTATVTKTGASVPNRVELVNYISEAYPYSISLTSWFDNVVASTTSPQAANTISWGANSYVTNDRGAYTWAISDTNWASWTNQYVAILYKDGALYDLLPNDLYHTSQTLGSQTGTFYFVFPEVGSYDIQLWKCPLGLCGLGSILANNTVRVTIQADTYLYVNSTVPVGSGMPFNINFMWGFTPSNPAYSGISTFKLGSDNVYYQESFKLLPQFGLNTISPTTLYTVNMSVYSEGLYQIRLEDYDKGVIKTTTTKAKAVNYPGTINITTPWLDILSSTYPFNFVLNQGIRVNYGIDGVNYTSNRYSFYLRTYNFDKQSYVGEKLIYQQLGDNVYILTAPSLPASKRFGIELDVIEGNNSLRLVGRNTTSEVIIDSENFTVSVKDVQGYGLYVPKSQICIKESIGITVYSPDPSLLTVYKTREGYSNLRDIIKTYRINSTSGMIINMWFDTVGSYALVLTKYDNTTVDRDLSVITCAVTPTPTATAPPSGIGETNVCTSTIPQINGWVGLMGFGLNDTTRLGFSLLFIMGFIFIGWSITKSGTIGLAFGFLPYAFFASLSFTDCGVIFMPKWVTIMEGLLMALSFRIFR